VILYVDTSALGKMLIAEAGSDQALHAWNLATARVTSLLAYAEARAALASASRAGRLTSQQHRRAKRQLTERLDQMLVVDVSEDVVFAAGDLAEAYGLRGYDAVHLASALVVADGDFALMTWDADLRHAAETAGLAVAGG